MPDDATQLPFSGIRVVALEQAVVENVSPAYMSNFGLMALKP